MNSETKVVAKNEAAQAAVSSVAKADLVMPRISRANDTSRASDVGRSGPVDSFADRYAAIGTGAYPARSILETSNERTGSVASGYKLASLSPELPMAYAPLSPTKHEQTRLIGFENSAFPYFGSDPRNGNSGYARGGRYGDNRVLVHVPAEFDARRRGVIVVFFHGHGATLERDVRDRQLLPKQISDSNVNAVLVAPQLAYDAADSSAGKFWERGGFKRFMAEAAEHLARVYGDPRAAEMFARMPIVVVAYSGGFVSAAWSLHVGGLGNRVRGLVLLDAMYGEMDKFSSWIASNRSAFFISAYTQHNKRRDDDFAAILKEKGIPVSYELNGPLRPGTVAFLYTGEGARHRDYVTRAWTENPVKDVLVRISQR